MVIEPPRNGVSEVVVDHNRKPEDTQTLRNVLLLRDQGGSRTEDTVTEQPGT